MDDVERVKKRRNWSLYVEYFFGGGERYKSRYRAVEVLSVAAFLYLAWLMAEEVLLGLQRRPLMLLLVPPIALGAHLGSDFFSGLVHWAADTYGTAKTPFVGPKFVAPFREHHRDPLAITRHDFIEANGDNSLCALSMMIIIHLMASGVDSGWATATLLYAVLLGCSVLLTSLAHGWAHMDEPPRVVRFFQRTGFLLTKEHHAEHHIPPYDRHYCITTGWLNALLDRTKFFRKAEAVLLRLGIRRGNDA
ncbi:MAG: fatty acid desaturase family protein [Polyangiaceae bacterium]